MALSAAALVAVTDDAPTPKPRSMATTASGAGSTDDPDEQKAAWAQFLRRNEPMLVPPPLSAPKGDGGTAASGGSPLIGDVVLSQRPFRKDVSPADPVSKVLPAPVSSSEPPRPFPPAADTLPTPGFETVPARDAASSSGGIAGGSQAVFLAQLQQRDIPQRTVGDGVGAGAARQPAGPRAQSDATRALRTATPPAEIGDSPFPTPEPAARRSSSTMPADGADVAPTGVASGCASPSHAIGESEGTPKGSDALPPPSTTERSYFIVSGIAGHARVKLKLSSDTELATLFAYFFAKVDAPSVVQQRSMFVWAGMILDGSKTPLDYGMGTSLANVNNVRVLPRKETLHRHHQRTNSSMGVGAGSGGGSGRHVASATYASDLQEGLLLFASEQQVQELQLQLQMAQAKAELLEFQLQKEQFTAAFSSGDRGKAHHTPHRSPQSQRSASGGGVPSLAQGSSLNASGSQLRHGSNEGRRRRASGSGTNSAVHRSSTSPTRAPRREHDEPFSQRADPVTGGGASLSDDRTGGSRFFVQPNAFAVATAIGSEPSPASAAAGRLVALEAELTALTQTVRLQAAALEHLALAAAAAARARRAPGGAWLRVLLWVLVFACLATVWVVTGGSVALPFWTAGSLADMGL